MKFNHLNRREPLSRFILTMGAADMVIGGVGHSASLFLLGLTTAGAGLLLRWARLKPRSPLWDAPPRALPTASPPRGSRLGRSADQAVGRSHLHPPERRIY